MVGQVLLSKNKLIRAADALYVTCDNFQKELLNNVVEYIVETNWSVFARISLRLLRFFLHFSLTREVKKL